MLVGELEQKAHGLAERSQREREIDRLAETIEQTDAHGHFDSEHVREQIEYAPAYVRFMVQFAFLAQCLNQQQQQKLFNYKTVYFNYFSIYFEKI